MEFDARKEIKLIIEKWLKDTLKKSDIKENDNLIEKGLSSMQVMQLSGILKKEGLRISFAKLIEKPTLNSWFDLVANSKIIKKHSKDNKKSNDGKDSFNLTDVQYSYFIGRSDDQTLGGVGCHAYIEIDGKDIDYKRLNDAWNKLQYRHPMLRTRFTEDGKQEILDKPFSEEIEVFDLSNLDKEETKIRLDEIRENLSHRKLRVEMGEVAGLKLANLSHNRNKIFFDLDLLVADVMSMSILLKELGEIYLGKELDNLINYTFKDYINNLEVDSEIYKKDQEFWKEKIDSFEIERPNLPLKKAPEQTKETRFTRRKRVIEKDKWSKIKELAASYKSTPSMVLLTAYALILERWTNQDKFFINLPLFNRDLSNENMKDMVADFTNILLVEHERKNDTSFLETLNRISKTFIDNVSHSSYSGVQVQRDISKSQGTSLNVAPVVFACNIDYPLETETSSKALGKITYMVSQTPGVWLDFQSYIKDGDLVLCWDSVDELFHEKMLDDMLNSLEEQLLILTEKENWESKFDVLSENQKLAREKELQSILPLNFPDERLYDGFIKNVKENPEKIAIIDSETKEEISYMDLYEKSLNVAGYLKENGIKKGDYVGITLPRSSKQIYAIFGILFSGAAYVAVGINQPSERRTKIYEQIGIKFVISDNKTIENCKLDTGEVSLIDLDKVIDKSLGLDNPIEVSPFDSAYIIMTSGTTGVPKGVEIMHTSAINTINDLNEKYSINSNDTLLMVSAIDFDLSVYDIFGILGVGGTLITNNEDNYRNPDEWIRIIEKYKVSVWDSVPILFDMLVTMAEGEKKNLPIRIVMLSGDWISKDLPGRFYKISEKENSIVVAMGGATEASIWSNYLNVPREIPKDWISIPYGKPLKNQVYRVVDELGRICPNYVKGELLIGGVGVAKCYHGDEDLTNKKYFEEDGIRWYRTGDNGRFWNDGTIEFLGRKDTQVKIKGHRIELGEIEDAISKFDGVKKVVVDFIEKVNSKNLVAFVKIDKDSDNFNTNKCLEKTDTSFIEEVEEICYEDIGAQNEKINNLVAKTIINVFKSFELDLVNNSYSIVDIYNKIKDSKRNRFIIENWINKLLSLKYLEFKNDKYSLREDKIFINEDNCNEDNCNNEIGNYLMNLELELTEILFGEKDPIEAFYSNSNKSYMSKFTEELLGYKESINSIINSIKAYARLNKKNIKILEYGTRNSELTTTIFKELKEFVSDYIYVDSSIYFRNNLSDLENDSKFKYVCINDNLGTSLDEDNFDIVIALNSIHRSNDKKTLIEEMLKVLKVKGLIIGNELKNNNLLPIITADIINEQPFNEARPADFDNNDCEVLYINSEKRTECSNFITFTIANLKENKPTFEKLRSYLSHEIPSYMIPTNFYQIDEIPLNKNGKVDRKKLKNKLKNKNKKEKFEISYNVKPKNELEITILKIWKDIFNNENIGLDNNYFSMGGDSLIATSIIGKIRDKLGLKLSIRDIFENPTVNELAIFINNNKCKEVENEQLIVSDKDSLYEPFPLTDVQMAYWIGRQGAYKLGNVSTHCYFEFDIENLDFIKLQNAINQMIKFHQSLRTIILDSGKQQILENNPEFLINFNDLTYLDDELKDRTLKQIRDDLSHRIIDLSKFPNFDFKVVKISDNLYRLYIGIDNTILDGWSMFKFLKEIKLRYDGNFVEKNIDISFRDYVLYKKENRKVKLEEDRKYWLDRLDSFPVDTNFLRVRTDISNTNQKFFRIKVKINKKDWLKIKEIGKNNNLTPTSILLTIFSIIISKYSNTDRFIINVTQFVRENVHPHINEIMGDFTELCLLEVNINKEKSIIENAKEIQTQLLNDMAHSSYSSIDFIREIRKIKKVEQVAPIVFTSGLGMGEISTNDFLGNNSYSISQTPQVWLDHQILELGGDLIITWDYLKSLFTEEMIDAIFKDYIFLINDFYNNFRSSIKSCIETEGNNILNENCTDYDICFNKAKDTNNSTNINYRCTENSNQWDNKLSKNIELIIKKILQIDELKEDDNFFSLGGNSLNMIQLSNKLLELYNYQLDFSLFLENANIAYLIDSIQHYIQGEIYE
ncbi:non-ribosomal peptide synthetase [Anaerococcus vaginalis]|uniref:non-ribosomal peptide synthetase n=1 Tax=Anaerococcus vaginalis TaxID=33037 RepID=UPI00242F8D96|nr:non-ribosomal peptide synthetase [Anaerococcus vaginalis]